MNIWLKIMFNFNRTAKWIFWQLFNEDNKILQMVRCSLTPSLVDWLNFLEGIRIDGKLGKCLSPKLVSHFIYSMNIPHSCDFEKEKGKRNQKGKLGKVLHYRNISKLIGL